MPNQFTLLPSRPQEPIATIAYHQWIFPNGNIWTSFYHLNSTYLLRFPALADFTISDDSNEVSCHPAPEVSIASCEHLFQNQVLPLVLSKRGKQVFHASAIDLADGAVVFMGESGRGKSTLAASFATNTFRFLTDDGLVLEKSANGYDVQPSHASIRLWSDSQQALISEQAKLAPQVQYTPKARILSGETLPFCNEVRPLRCIYFLGNGDAEQVLIESMSPSEAMIGLVKHSFLLDLDERDTLATHFGQLSKMVRLPIFYRLDYPRNFDQLPKVREAIMLHASAIFASPRSETTT